MNSKALSQIAFSLMVIVALFTAILVGSTRTLQAMLTVPDTVTAAK